MNTDIVVERLNSLMLSMIWSDVTSENKRRFCIQELKKLIKDMEA